MLATGRPTHLLTQIGCKFSLAEFTNGAVYPRLVVCADQFVCKDTAALMHPQCQQVSLRADDTTTIWLASTGRLNQAKPAITRTVHVLFSNIDTVTIKFYEKAHTHACR
jgi:hypothetical protein